MHSDAQRINTYVTSCTWTISKHINLCTRKSAQRCTAYQHVCHFMYMNQKETFVVTRCWCSQIRVFLFVLLIFWPWSCQGPPSTQGLLNFTRDPFGPGNRWHVSTLSTCSLHAAYMFNLATFTNAGNSDQLREYDFGLSGMSRVLVSFAWFIFQDTAWVA